MSRKVNNKRTQPRIEDLYSKLTNQSITQPELEELYSLLSENTDTLHTQMADTWKNIKIPGGDQGMTTDIKETQRMIALKTSRVKKLRWWTGVAAGILVLVIALIGLNRDRTTTFYTTGYGERETILLPDGSSVKLNANSTLSWDEEWESTGIRQVHLTGEAFFDVTHLSQHQKFCVSTADLNIEVLGTSFNVLNRNTNTEVFLQEGKVKLGFEGNQSRLDSMIMVPGQKVSYSREEDQVIHNTGKDLDKVASWKDGVLYFEDKMVSEILEEISQVYGIEYMIPDEELARKKMNFGVPYSDWETTKEAFELTMGLKIDQVDQKYIVQ